MLNVNHLERIAILGASGNVGSATLRNLLAINPNIHITVLSRSDSKATFPNSLQIDVKKGSYDDEEFLINAFRGNQAAMFTFAFGNEDAQLKLIEAAAKAGVKYIIPNEFAGNCLHPIYGKEVPLVQPKNNARKHIENLSRTYPNLKWIAVATNPWTEPSLAIGLFGTNVAQRTVTFEFGSGEFNSTSLNQVGLGIAKLLSLPLTNDTNPRASLQHYENNYVYLSSFVVTQQSLFEATKKATGTKHEDWTIKRSSIEERIKVNKAKFEQGDFFAGAHLTYAYYMGEGLGGNYEEKSKADREVLDLEEEKLEDVIKRAVEQLQ